MIENMGYINLWQGQKMESHGIVRFRLFGDNPEFNGETVHLIIAVCPTSKVFSSKHSWSNLETPQGCDF